MMSLNLWYEFYSWKKNFDRTMQKPLLMQLNNEEGSILASIMPDYSGGTIVLLRSCNMLSE